MKERDKGNGRCEYVTIFVTKSQQAKRRCSAAATFAHLFTLNHFNMKHLIAAFFALTLLSACDSPESFSDKVMQDIKDGQIRFLRTPAGGRILHDPESRMSNDFIQHVLKLRGSESDYDKIFDAQPLFFNLPDILEFKRTDSSPDSVDLSIPSVPGDSMPPKMYEAYRCMYRVRSPLKSSNVQVISAKTGLDDEWKVIVISQE